MTDRDVIVAVIVGGIIVFLVLRPVYRHWVGLRRAEFIRSYTWPRGLLERLEKHHPGFERKDSALVSRGLRQFFLAYAQSGRKFVSMPSQIADDLWHEFILYTREYQAFCRKAFGGFLHHAPAVVLSADRKNNEGLRRVWWHCCREENIDPVHPTRLPLLFALDAKYRVAGGFTYHRSASNFARTAALRRALPIAEATLRVRRSTEAPRVLAIHRAMAAAAIPVAGMAVAGTAAEAEDAVAAETSAA